MYGINSFDNNREFEGQVDMCCFLELSSEYVIYRKIEIDEEIKTCTLSLEIDSTISPVMDYFEIFLGRMVLCRKAAEKLGLQFKLNINGQALI